MLTNNFLFLCVVFTKNNIKRFDSLDSFIFRNNSDFYIMRQSIHLILNIRETNNVGVLHSTCHRQIIKCGVSKISINIFRSSTRIF